MSKAIAAGWAVQSPSGVMIAVADSEATEDEAWMTALWVSPSDGHFHDAVAEAKRRGARAFRVEIREIEE